MAARGKTALKAPTTTPDIRTKEARKSVDNVVEMQEPPKSSAFGFPIVGIGASAGGLAAFEAFFSGMPEGADPGMAFVLVQHLAPEYKSMLTALIQRYTRMQVFEVVDGMEVQPNCAYIIPPGRDMAFLDGRLKLSEPSAPRGQRLPIDFFFRSLAQDQHERAICIVLSGTGSDGTLGVRAIKAEGGMVMAQTPDSTEFDGMPRSVIATGLVDFELLPAEMPSQLMAYIARAFGNPVGAVSASERMKTEASLQKVFTFLHAQRDHDFSKYTPDAIYRRIEQRLAIHQINTIESYVEYLQQNPAEIEALYRVMLSGVTSFFRNPDDFQALEEKLIPRLFAGKADGETIRVWVPGCSTGEEAYSLAILLQENLERLKQSNKVLVFATDLDSKAIATARAGRYPASIAADISPERMSRFFTIEADGRSYRIHKGIRDILVFSEQNLIKDPPFSRLDLISCRNIMISLGGDLQKRLLPLFHYALNPGGFLFLEASEAVGDIGHLFACLDPEFNLYSREADMNGSHRTALGWWGIPPLATMNTRALYFTGKKDIAGKLSLRELTEQVLLRQVAPTGALVNANGDVLYLHGRTGMYLEPAPGEVRVNNILDMAREGLRPALTLALHQAVDEKEIVRRSGLLVKFNNDFTAVNLTVCPLASRPDPACEKLHRNGVGTGLAAPMLFLVIMEEALAFNPTQVQDSEFLHADEDIACSDSTGSRENARIATLRQELWAKEEYLQTANEELKSTNEELQSVNEELQSTNEELQTSKEEMQSINEELFTVNAELQTRVVDLSRANNDMNNLLAGTGIATIFLDNELRILRFTPNAAGLINLIPSDIGRSVSHIASNMVGYDRLTADAQAVLDTLIPHEIEVQSSTSRRYLLRIIPYRTLDDVIEGVVLTFVDNTDSKCVRDSLKC